MTRLPYRVVPALVALAIVLLIEFRVPAQLGERPGNSNDNPSIVPRDLSGLSIKNPRTRVVHTTDPRKKGGSMYLQQMDPFLGYKWGWSLTQREFRERDGVFTGAGKLDGITLPDGVSKMMSRGHVSSCGMCHNVPYRDGGAGATIAKNGGDGRNTPHMFGGGLVEMIGQQIRLMAMAQADANRDGWISKEEARGKRCIIRNLPEDVPGSVEIDLGSFDDDGSGRPGLNPILNPIYVDKHGKRIVDADSLNYPGVAGYRFEVQCFGAGHLYMPKRPPVSTTLRSFTATPFDIHMSLQAFDPTTLNEQDGTGWAQVSNAGCLQCVTAAGSDKGLMRGPTGISRDNPTGDGFCEKVSEGELDVTEWYLLNHPAPARGQITDEVKHGEQVFHKIGCADCHVPDWHLYKANPNARDYTQRFDGDRRFFELQVGYNDKRERLEGKLVLLADKQLDGRWIPRRDAYTVRGIYSDFKYHDMGEAFTKMQFDGSVIRKWRTLPLWGAGSTAPYGHDGASLTLDDVIRRHGGEGLKSRQKYAALSRDDRRDVIDFLNSLILYQTEKIPCDIDGDGDISEHFMVAGMDTGYERFNPEWLFVVPGKIEGPVINVRGERIISNALTNVRSAYGLNLEYLKDTDEDGFPDVIDPAPLRRGYKDGER